MEDLGPLSMLMSWQTLVLALIVAACTSGVKTLVDYGMGGKEKRKKHALLNEVVLPALPISLGVLGGAFIPIHPAKLIAYVNTNEVSMMVVGGAYGAVVGMFSDWLYHRVRARMKQAASAA